MILPISRQLGYASGNFGKSLMWTSLEYFLLFYLTDLVGLPPEVAGTIILISLAWDGAINPLLGYWIDRRAALGHDYRPFLRWAPPVAALLFIAIFVPHASGQPAGAPGLLLALLLFRTAYAALDVPHNALLAQMPTPAGTRTTLASMRFFFSSLGGLVVAGLVAPVLAQAGATDAPAELLLMSVVAGVMLCATIWQSLGPARLALAGRATRMHPPAPWRYLRRILRNRTAMAYLALAALVAATTPLFAKGLPYLLHYVRGEPELLAPMLMAMTTGQMLAMPVLAWLAARIGHDSVIRFCFAGIFVACLGLFAAIGGASWLVCALAAAFGFCLGGAIMVVWAVAGDIVDHLAAGKVMRADGGLIAFLTLAQKAGIGLGALLAGLIMRSGGFEPGAAQSQGAILAIEITTLAVPAVGATAAAGLFARLRRSLSAPEPSRPA